MRSYDSNWYCHPYGDVSASLQLLVYVSTKKIIRRILTVYRVMVN
jgi:hypothetical protein